MSSRFEKDDVEKYGQFFSSHLSAVRNIPPAAPCLFYLSQREGNLAYESPNPSFPHQTLVLKCAFGKV